MLTLEEYIRKRKKEDNLNEFDIELKMDNMRVCVNYVFEYFNQYLDINKVDEKTVLNNERIEKFKNQLQKYEPEIQDWLVAIFEDHDKQIHKSIISFLKKDELFLVYHTDQGFRSASYECYAHLAKKNPFLKDQTEMLFLFIKDYHRIKSQPKEEFPSPFISAEINEWVEKTWTKYRVNLYEFASEWANRFSENEALWDTKHRIRSKDGWRRYEYDYKQKRNLFSINLLFRKISNKPFMKGKKQFLEILLMYCWLHEIDGDENYWDEYINKTLQLPISE